MTYSESIKKKVNKMFKVGQRVKLKVGSPGSPDARSIGVIKKASTVSAGVEFPGWGKGHNLGNNLIEPDGWNISYNNLEIVESDWDE